MNARYFDETQKLTCNSCHRGTTAPVAQPSLDAQRWMDFNRVEGPLPDGAGLIARYQKLTGIAAAVPPHTERASYEMTIYLSEAAPRKEFTELTKGGPNQFRMSRTSDSGTEAWLRNGADVCSDMEFDDYKQVGPVLLPFLVQILNPSGNGLTIRKVKERTLLPHPDVNLFTKPETAS